MYGKDNESCERLILVSGTTGKDFIEGSLLN